MLPAPFVPSSQLGTPIPSFARASTLTLSPTPSTMFTESGQTLASPTIPRTTGRLLRSARIVTTARKSVWRGAEKLKRMEDRQTRRRHHRVSTSETSISTVPQNIKVVPSTIMSQASIHLLSNSLVERLRSIRKRWKLGKEESSTIEISNLHLSFTLSWYCEGTPRGDRDEYGLCCGILLYIVWDLTAATWSSEEQRRSACCCSFFSSSLIESTWEV